LWLLCQVISKSLELWRSDTIPFNRLYLFLTAKCVLDLRGREAGVAHDTSSYFSDYFCQVFSKSFDLRKSYGPDRMYPVTDFVNLWPPSDLEGGDRLLRVTHHLIVNNCGKYLQNPFKHKKFMDRTQHIPSNRQCWPWISKCNLHPGGRGLVVAHDTSSYYNKYLCQVISNSFDKWQSYGPDTKVWRMDDRTWQNWGLCAFSLIFMLHFPDKPVKLPQ
jgi:hypothetical protein